MLAAGHLIGHSEWTTRKPDIGSHIRTVRAESGAPQQEDDMPYREWPDADKQALLDDLWRMLAQGKKIDGTMPEHVVAGSIGHVVELVDLVRVGDDPDPATGDTHPGLDTVNRKLDEVLAALAPPVPPQGA